tara:strand:+ start:9427 stop:10092 length:666 start_codon:yes stop_codon:yes gene_type:complete
MIIAIDGPAGSGKSTIAKIIAERLQYKYINSGSMYRAVAREVLKRGLDLSNEENVARVAESLKIDFVHDIEGQRVLVNDEDVTQELKSETVGAGAAIVASQVRVREILTAQQRELGRRGQVVMEGRDIGTKVFPNADKKFYFHAEARERGRRRYLELKAKNTDVSLEEIIEQIRQRDYEDTHRAVAPLIQAKDAVYVDTTYLNIDQLADLTEEKIKRPPQI